MAPISAMAETVKENNLIYFAKGLDEMQKKEL